MAQKGLTYEASGVSIKAAEAALEALGPAVRATHDKFVRGAIGPFASALDLGALLGAVDCPHPLLVQSTDGPGTIPILAREWNVLHPEDHPFRSIGYNVMAHCTADLACAGARPITILDSIESMDVSAQVHADLVAGVADCCLESALPWRGRIMGGEIAQLPGLIVAGETSFDLMITGLVDETFWLNPWARVRPGGVVVGIDGSGGAHLNGLSLIRKIRERHHFGLDMIIPKTDKQVAQMLFARQPNYGLLAVRHNEIYGPALQACCHITGGGLHDNIVRCLPPSCRVVIDAHTWEWPPLFHWLMKIGPVKRKVAFATWNMGIGFVEVVDPKIADELIADWQAHGIGARRIGEVVKARRGVTINF